MKNLLIFIGCFLITSSIQSQVAELHLKRGETLYINDNYYNRVFNRVILEDNSKIILGVDVYGISIVANKAEIGYNVYIGIDESKYHGKNGRNGKHARRRDRAGDCANGYNGQNGQNGVSGIEAPNIYLAMNIYELASLKINARGGNGGNAGNGGNGMSGTKADCSSTCHGGRGGSGGYGGYGGHGNAGGDITFKYRFVNSSGNLGRVSAYTNGGKGGKNGYGGKGARGGAGKNCHWKKFHKGANGRNGGKGSKGKNGKFGKYDAIQLPSLMKFDNRILPTLEETIID